MFERIAIIGMGLIGSSIAHGIRRSKLTSFIAGHTQSESSTKVAQSLGLADEMYPTPEHAVQDADLIILCTPVGTYESLTSQIVNSIKPGAILTDVGSVKKYVIDAVLPHLTQDIHFIPAHPIAGTEESGPASGFAELFDNRWCILTPPPNSNPKYINKLKSFWEAMGAKVEFMEAEHHDTVLAVTSHVPHLIAYTMVGTADHLRRISNFEVVQFSAAGFRDFTRIAASDPTMWRDVFLTNKESTLDILGRFTEELLALQRLIRTNDGEKLFEYFTETRNIRRGIVEAGQDTAIPNFGRDNSKK
ncbi:MAG: prephenate/arogenate dehydrogenase family protein [Rhodobacteraceae bacterium]|nr:prephenate/arogenate dehydrogenase family protein [Paracoccaceae bacterium]